MSRLRELLDQLPDIDYAAPENKHYIDYALLKALTLTWSLMPTGFNIWSAHRLTDLVVRFLKKRNEQCLQNIREVLDLDQDDERANKILSFSYRLLAENMVYLVNSGRFSRKRVDCQFVTEGFEHIHKAEEAGRGIILVTCHMACWELMNRVFKTQDMPMAIMVAVQHNPLSDRLINTYRSQQGCHKILHNRLSVRHALKYLKNGGRLIVVADIDMGDKGITVPFLGKPASSPRGPADLALRTGALIHVGTVQKKKDDKFHVCIQEGIDSEKFSGDREKVVFDITNEMNLRMSEKIRETPEQWLWAQRRWKTKVT